MERLFPYAKEALENTNKIAERCNVEIEFRVPKLPRYAVPEGYSSWEYLNKLCFEGLEKRYPNYEEKTKKQLEYELSVIQKMGYVDYFLIVWDFIHFAREHQIPVGLQFYLYFPMPLSHMEITVPSPLEIYNNIVPLHISFSLSGYFWKREFFLRDARPWNRSAENSKSAAFASIERIRDRFGGDK